MCNPPKAHAPEARTGPEDDHTRSAVSKKRTEKAGYVCIPARRDHPTHEYLLAPGVKMVHVNGHLFVWLLELIIERCPDLEKVEVIPSLERKITDAHKSVAAAAGIQIVVGHAYPQMAWDEGERRPSKDYHAQREFFVGLAGVQRKLWEELLALGFEEAQIAQDYYGLEGKEPKSQADLLMEYGFTPTLASYMSAQVNAVMRYLDPSFKCSKDATDYARRFKDRVARIRQLFKKEEALQEFARSLGVSRLPEGLPPAFFDKFELVVRARQNNRLFRLYVDQPRRYEAISLRYDVHYDDREPRQFRRLQEVGDMMGGITREAVRQLEDAAFKYLE